MRNIALLTFLLVGLVGVAYAEDEPAGEEAPRPELKRGFDEGKFTDEYFGVVFEAPELKEGFGLGLGGNQVLWSGKCAGGVDVELICVEPREPMAAKALMENAKKAWAEDGKERKEMEEGLEPTPWVLFVQESLAGFQRHHGWAYYARGPQNFIVHAQVREKSDTSGEAIKAALGGLKLADKSDSFLFAHLVAKNRGADPRDPLVMLEAGSGYLGQNIQNHPRGLALLLLAKEHGYDSFDDNQKWNLMQGIGLAQLMTGKHAESIPTWLETVKLSEKTDEPQALLANSLYNLACGYSLLGKLDEAFDTLKKAFAVPHESIQGLKEHAQQDPDLKPMREQEERWKALFS